MNTKTEQIDKQRNLKKHKLGGEICAREREREIFSFWNRSIKELIDEKIGETVMEQGLSKLKKPFYL